MIRSILKGLAVVLVVLVLLVAAALGYLFKHQELITQEVETWYESKYAGELTLGKVYLSSWQDWPFLRLEIEHLSLRDTSWHGPDSTTLEIGKLRAELSLREVFQKRIYLDKLELEDGHLLFLTDIEGGNNHSIFRKLHSEEQGSSFLRLEEGIDLILTNFWLVREDKSRNKRMAGDVTTLSAHLTHCDTAITGLIKMEGCVEGLGFNLAKGVYLGESQVRGQFQFLFDRITSTIEIPQFPLYVQEQVFQTEVCMDRTPGGAFHISLINDQTDFQATKLLLPAHLQRKLERYEIIRPLPTAIYLRGAFESGNNPWVRVDFQADDNEVKVADQMFSAFRGTGSFANRLDKNPAIALFEDRKNLSLELVAANCVYKGAALYFEKATFRSTRQVPIYFDLDLNAKGKLEDLNTILGNENFFFAGGRFNTQLKVAGTAETLPGMLKTASGRLYIENTKVQYSPSQVTVPLTELEVLLSPERAVVPSIRIPLSEEQEIRITGSVKNFSSLIFEEKNKKVESDLTIYSADFNLDNFLSLLASLQPADTANTVQQNKLSETVAGIYTTFSPRLKLRIDRFTYQDQQARDIQSQLHFLDAAHLQLDSTWIYTGNSEIFLKGVFTVPDSAKYVRVNMKIEAEGDTKDFNDAFSNDTFLFQEGAYHYAGSINGTINSLPGLLHSARGQLLVEDANIYFVPENLQFNVPKIDLKVAQQGIIIEELRLGMPIGGELHLNGRVENFMGILSGEDAPLVRSFIGLHADYLDYADFSSLFSSSLENKTASRKKEVTSNQIKHSLKDLYQKFYPELVVQIDSFRHGDFLVTAINSEIAFQGRDFLQFAEMGFEYRGSPVSLNAILGLSDETYTPIDLKLNTTYFDLGALVETYDYFGFPALQSAEKIAGKVSLKADLRGQIIDSMGLDPKSLMGAIRFTLHEAELVNFAPIQEIGDKFFRTERFESIRFAPVTDTLYITQEVIHIPQMEIQSTAFNLFIEGHLNYDNNTNIWVSVPWRNFNAWEEGMIPPKTGYHQAGAKLYVEVKGNEEGTLDYGFRLSKRKLYKHKGIFPIYREDRRYERQLRKSIRKEKRVARRLLKKGV